MRTNKRQSYVSAINKNNNLFRKKCLLSCRKCIQN